ncbi:MAG: mitochondrial fission ELM1 family protein [Holosporales bacterium]
MDQNRGICWVVCDEGKVGTENQCRGLAEALGFDPVIKRIRPRFPWSHLPPQLWFQPLAGLDPETQLTPPWPNLIIAAGRVSVAPTIEIRRRSQGTTKLVHLQNPRVNPCHFDAVIAPAHDQLKGPGVIETRGALHRVTQERLMEEAQKFAATVAHLPRPLVTVLIGGDNSCYTYTPAALEELAKALRHLCHAHGAGLAITCSRRTDPQHAATLRALIQDLPHVFWEGEGENPYFGYLGLADAIVVTSDSVNMNSEACFTGKPVYTFHLPGGSKKFRRFHDSFVKYGYTRPFKGLLEHWSYEPLDEREAVLEALKKRLSL